MRQGQKNKQKSADKDIVKTEPDRERKDDLIAFLPPVKERGKDFISSLPTETLHEILSYLILDHDPNRGPRYEASKNKNRPHVFLSLSVLSKHFCRNVESFCLHHLTQFKEIYHFQPPARLNTEPRRSARLAAKPKKVGPEQGRPRKSHAAWWVVRKHCEENEFPTTIHAMNVFDLRDHMLLKSRSPGPRANQIDLPSVPYGTVRVNLGCGRTTASCRLFNNDVLTIATKDKTGDKSEKQAYQQKIGEAHDSIQRKNWQDLCKLHPSYDYPCPIPNCEVCSGGAQYPDY
ncbi:hypothetical protein D0864_14033 [Hortaea werneckii]|uniref:Uncharacterized protein n=1 Tax=Hortaea werneckii TaxID=91943 RepID=A0A3M7CPV5_HORWE|nr:hypothetical protein D0864_14033 [Hortaea werneckii]